MRRSPTAKKLKWLLITKGLASMETGGRCESWEMEEQRRLHLIRGAEPSSAGLSDSMRCGACYECLARKRAGGQRMNKGL